MELLTGLRPTGPTLDRSNAATHERGVTDSAGEARGFDEHLDQFNQRRASLPRDEGSSRSEDRAARARPAASESHAPHQKEEPAAAEDARSEHASSNPPAAAKPEPARQDAAQAAPVPARAAQPNLAPEIAVVADPEIAPSTEASEVTPDATATQNPPTPALSGEALIA